MLTEISLSEQRNVDLRLQVEVGAGGEAEVAPLLPGERLASGPPDPLVALLAVPLCPLVVGAPGFVRIARLNQTLGQRAARGAHCAPLGQHSSVSGPGQVSQPGQQQHRQQTGPAESGQIRSGRVGVDWMRSIGEDRLSRLKQPGQFN